MLEKLCTPRTREVHLHFPITSSGSLYLEKLRDGVAMFLYSSHCALLLMYLKYKAVMLLLICMDQ